MVAVCRGVRARLATGAILGWVGWGALAMSLSLPSLAAQPSWSERDVAIAAPGAILHGSLVLPAGEGIVPGVLLLAGSGPTDRDGNQPQFQARSDTLRLLAHGLAEAGIASLRVDKRGVGRSLPADFHQQDLRFEHYVEDAVRWLAVLREEPRVGPLFVVGHSEGGLIGILAAERTPLAGLVTLAAPGFPLGTVLRQQFAASPIWPAPLKESAMHIIEELEAGRTARDLPPELALMFQPAVQPYLISQFRYDPAVEIAKLRLPILIVQGDRDLQVSVADARRLAAAAQGADLAIVRGMNHVLRDAPPDRAGNLALYNRPDVPLAAVLPSLVALFRAASRGTP